MRALLLLCCFSLAAQERPNESSVKEREIEVVLGIDKIVQLDFSPSTKIQVGNGDVLSYTLIPVNRELTFKGLKPGKTSVTVRDTVGEIKERFIVTITSNDQSNIVAKLKEFLGEIEGIEIKIKGGSVVVEGNIIVPADIGRIAVILNRDEFKNVISLIELSPLSQRIIAKKMQDEIQKSGIRDVTVRVVNGSYWLEGFVTREGDDALALKIAEGLLPDRLDNLSQATGAVSRVRKAQIVSFISPNIKRPDPPLPKLIKITAQFVELAKDYTRDFGFKWLPTITEGGGQIGFGRRTDGDVSTSSGGTLSGTISNLFPKLASAKSAGNARVIQSGLLLIKDGTRDARITKTTTIPFALGTGEFTKAESAEAGFDLRITPRISVQENIEMDIGLSVKVTTGAGTVPQTINNSVSTSVLVPSGDSAAIGGISIKSDSTEFDRSPPFGVDQFPQGTQPLFSFLRSKSRAKNKSQFVVFITPEIVASASEGTQEIKKKFRRRRR